ncbi:MAG: sensor domain-containing diguanylate cyclase [Pseudomonadota bacterium]|nr:sensor domain-containing diguanylate cyclase [Pseudomonadota bacterium]
MITLRYVAQLSAALISATEAILRAPSEEQLFHLVCEAIISGGSVIGAVALVAESDNWLRPVAGAGAKVEAIRALALSVDLHSEQHPGFIATAFRSGRAVYINDYLTDTQFAKWHDSGFIGIRAAAVVPIIKNKCSIGALLCCFDQPNALCDEQVTLLERTAENISFALDNFERKKQYELAARAAVRLTRMFAALSATNEAIMRAATRAELCQRVCEAAVLGGNFTSASIAFATPDGEVLDTMAAAGPAADRVRGLQIPLLHPERLGVGGIAFRSKQPCITNDYLTDTRLTYWYDQIHRTGTKSGAGWPLFKGSEPVGALIFMSSELGTFTPELIELMQRLADNVSFALVNFDRIDEKLEADEKIKYVATHDGLTGLINRAMFSQILDASIETSRRHDRQFALLFIDLDGFKIINDTLGHSCGDALLIEVAKRLCENVRSSDAVARLGGDEFVVILQEIHDRQEVRTIAQKLLSSIMKPLLLREQECGVTASVGVAIFPSNGEDEETLTKNADVAMYLAKNEGKNSIRFFSSNLKTPLLERLMPETSLRDSLESNPMP